MISKPHDLVPRLGGFPAARLMGRSVYGPRTASDRISAEGRLTVGRRCADFSEALEPLGLPAVLRAHHTNRRLCTRAIAAQETMSYAGRLITFIPVSAAINLAAVCWIFLRIGS